MSSIVGVVNNVEGSDLTRDNTRGTADWLGRKILAIPKALWSGVVRVTQILFQALFGASRQNDVSVLEPRRASSDVPLQTEKPNLYRTIREEIREHLGNKLLADPSASPLSGVKSCTLTIAVKRENGESETENEHPFGRDDVSLRFESIMNAVAYRLDLVEKDGRKIESFTVKVTLGLSEVVVSSNISEDDAIRN